MTSDRERSALTWTDELRRERLRRIELAIQGAHVEGSAIAAGPTDPCVRCREATTGEAPCPVHQEDAALLQPLGRVLGERYRIDGLLGAGGIGAVYGATDLSSGRRVAVKLLRPEYASHPELLARFHREARTLTRLRHPHIVAVTDFGKREQEPFMVMELLVGRSLEAELFEGPLPAARALAITRQILAALGHAHGHGVVHRDLKPQNMMIVPVEDDPLGAVKVLDFGLAKVAPETRHTGDRTLTQGQRVFGTPGYMSPEQAAGRAADERSDLYNAGLILFELLTARPPFSARSQAELLRHQRQTPAPSMRSVAPQADISWALDAVVARCLAKAPDARFQSATELSTALDLAERMANTDPHLRVASPLPRGPSETQVTARGSAVPRRRPLARRVAMWARRLSSAIADLVTPGDRA